MGKIETFKNRGEFTNAMLDKYYAKTPNTVISDIGAGFGHTKEKIKLLHAT